MNTCLVPTERTMDEAQATDNFVDNARLEEASDESLALDYQTLSLPIATRQSALSQLMQRYEVELFQFLFRFVSDRGIAEDLFQESFLQVHLSIASYDSTRRFRPWLFTIAANKARDHLRKKKMLRISDLKQQDDDQQGPHALLETVFLEHSPSPIEALNQRDLNQHVREKVQELPDNLRETLILCYFHHFAYAQIAEMLAIPIGTVKSRIHSAVAKLSKTINPERLPNH